MESFVPCVVSGVAQGQTPEEDSLFLRGHTPHARISPTAIVDQKAPSDAAAYKDWLLQIANSVAEASKEGGFLGFGGVHVSDAEKATLSEIAATLGRTA